MFIDELFENVSFRVLQDNRELATETTAQLCESRNYESSPGSILHSVFGIKNFSMCDRLDWYCVVNPVDHTALFFDTGHPVLTGTEMMDSVLHKYDIPWSNVTVFLTHFHIDHSGNFAYCLQQGAKEGCFIEPIAYSDSENNQFFVWTQAPNDLREDTFAREHLQLVGGKDYFTSVPLQRCRTVSQGECFEIGGFCFEVFPTPGHAPEHACLVDYEKQIMVAGDHLLFAKPGMMQLAPDQHLMALYMDSLSIIRSFRIQALLMSHHAPLYGASQIDDFIKQTQRNYVQLLDKAQDKVALRGAVSPYSMANALAQHYPRGIRNFAPAVQMRRIALAFGTLEGLYDEGRVERRQEDNGGLVYFVKRGR